MRPGCSNFSHYHKGLYRIQYTLKNDSSLSENMIKLNAYSEQHFHALNSYCPANVLLFFVKYACQDWAFQTQSQAHCGCGTPCQFMARFLSCPLWPSAAAKKTLKGPQTYRFHSQVLATETLNRCPNVDEVFKTKHS